MLARGLLAVISEGKEDPLLRLGLDVSGDGGSRPRDPTHDHLQNRALGTPRVDNATHFAISRHAYMEICLSLSYSLWRTNSSPSTAKRELSGSPRCPAEPRA